MAKTQSIQGNLPPEFGEAVAVEVKAWRRLWMTRVEDPDHEAIRDEWLDAKARRQVIERGLFANWRREEATRAT